MQTKPVNPSVHGIVEQAVNSAVDYLFAGTDRDAAVNVTAAGKPSSIIWVNLSNWDGKRFAETCDRDFMVGYPPSFHHVTEGDDSAEMKAAIVAFFVEKFAGAEAVTVQAHHRAYKGRTIVPTIFEGTSESGVLEVKAELPSC